MQWIPPSEIDPVIECPVEESGSGRGHKLKSRGWVVVVLLGLSFLAGAAGADAATPDSRTGELSALFDQLVQEGSLVGAQVVVGQAERIDLEYHVGWRSHRQMELVDADTSGFLPRLFTLGQEVGWLVGG